MSHDQTSVETIISQTEEWLEKAVIGLNLCPFAKPVHVKKQIRYTVSRAKTMEELLEDLVAELQFLQNTDPDKIETTLLIHPQILTDFLEFNDFLEVADEALVELDMVGEIQIASFHPQYQFEGTTPEDIENYTNRSPYPTLHLLREDSLEKAIESYPDTEEIFKQNIETLKKLGLEGWKKLRLSTGH